VSLVLVIGRARQRPPGGGLAGLWGALAAEVDRVRRVPAGVLAHARVADLEAAALESPDTTVAYAEDPDAVEAAVERAIAQGAGEVVVMPIAVAVDQAEAPDPRFHELRGRIGAVCRRHTDVEVVYVGPPFDDPPALERAISLFHATDAEAPQLLRGAIERAFEGDAGRFGRFMARLQSALPDGTLIALRGSAVQGASYKTKEPFDNRGPGTSDLDFVLIGDGAMAEWLPEAFYLPGVNTMPLWDEARWVAPRLDPARTEAQELAGRPVSLQSMARWFLDLRSGLQGTPYVLLGA
jgi:hypothetical protein